MNSKEALETLGNVEVAVTTIRSGRKHFKTLKQQYETEFEVLEREMLIKKELKDFDVYQRQLEQLEKENKELKEHSTELFDRCALLTLKVEELKKENKELEEINEQLEGCNKEVSEFAYQIEMEREVLKEKVDELEQVIEKIKKLPHCDICDANWHKGCLCLQKKIKEVFENDR